MHSNLYAFPTLQLQPNPTYLFIYFFIYALLILTRGYSFIAFSGKSEQKEVRKEKREEGKEGERKKRGGERHIYQLPPTPATTRIREQITTHVVPLTENRRPFGMQAYAVTIQKQQPEPNSSSPAQNTSSDATEGR